jgi:Putative zinc-finger
MSTRSEHRLWPACLSALHLDRFLMGELSGPDAERVRAHLAECARCTEAVSGLRMAREQPLPPLRMVPLASRSRPRLWRRAAAAVVGLAAAASVVLVLRPPAGERVKGPGFSLRMYVEHDGQVRRAGPGEMVAAGDALRFAVTAPMKAYVAVLSLDPAGHGSVYFPIGARAAPVEGGGEVALPLGTRLDATVGEERIVGLFCSSPVELEPLRVQLERGGPSVPSGCQVTRWSFVKR